MAKPKGVVASSDEASIPPLACLTDIDYISKTVAIFTPFFQVNVGCGALPVLVLEKGTFTAMVEKRFMDWE